MKILLIDIETAPNLGYTWGKWEQDVIEFKKDWYILSFVAKWLGERKMICSKIIDFSAFKKDHTNDRGVCVALWKLLDEADVVVAHNGQAFDTKKIQARMLIHGMKPPRPFAQVDTKLVFKKYFKFDSNKLDELGRQLGVGRKLPHTGFDLWLKCMDGDKKAWALMEAYNKQDVLLLEQLYLKVRGWMRNHPNHNLYDGTRDNCPNCGSPGHRQWVRAYKRTQTSEYKQYQCQDCGAYSRGNPVRLPKGGKVERRNIPVS